jgi:hypothetical protein
VLNGEKREQRHVDDQRLGERNNRPAIDRLRHHQAGDEADRIKERDKEKGIGNESVNKGDDTSHRSLLAV